MAEPDLHWLIGVPRDVSPVELRYAYERAMRQATRSGDHQRAMALSAAFDALPSATKGQVYGNSRESTQVASPPAPPRIPPSAWAEFAQPGGRRRPHRQRDRRRRGTWLRVIGYGLGVPAVIAALAYAAVHFGYPIDPTREGGDPPQVTIRTQQIDAPQPAVETAQRVRGYGPTMQVPSNAPTGANGVVTLVCQPTPDRPGYLMTAPRGALVACGNGAIPKVVG